MDLRIAADLWQERAGSTIHLGEGGFGAVAFCVGIDPDIISRHCEPSCLSGQVNGLAVWTLGDRLPAVHLPEYYLARCYQGPKQHGCRFG